MQIDKQSLGLISSHVSVFDLINLGSLLEGENRPDSPSIRSLNWLNELHPNSAYLGSFLIGWDVSVHKDASVEVTKSELFIPLKYLK